MRYIRYGIKSLLTILTLGAHFEALALNNIKFANRAQCAIESEFPTQSVLMILDSYNSQKMAHNIAISTKSSPQEITSKAALEYRLATTQTTLKVMQKLMEGKLPLLPTDLNQTQGLDQYLKIAKLCEKKVYCRDLTNYISKLWIVSQIENPERRNQEFAQIDHMNSSSFMNSTQARGLQCYLLKKFSPLQSHIYTPKADTNQLNQIATAYLDQKKYITSCFDQSPEINKDYAALQIEIQGYGPKWKEVGFDFWNSVKIYTSWAWRYSEILPEMSKQFHHLFRSLAFEESMMLLPNGCQSITPPRCDLDSLSENSIRELAKRKTVSKEHLKSTPQGPERELLKETPPAINEDILAMQGRDTDAWIKNFREQFLQARGLSKTRVQGSMQKLHLIHTEIKQDNLISGIKKVAKLAEKDLEAKRQMFMLCQETRLSADSRLDFLRTDIDAVLSTRMLEKANHFPGRNWALMKDYFQNVSNEILPICDDLSLRRVTAVSTQVKAEEMRPWAQEIIYEQIYKSEGDSGLIKSLTRTKPFILWNKKAGLIQGNTLCYDEVDCYRTILESIVELHAAAKYAAALLPVQNQIPSSAMLNPYADLKACQIYDPWLATKAAYKNLLKDGLNTVLFGWNFIPIYFDSKKALPKVTSFKKLVEDGVIKFDPQIAQGRDSMTLIADLGAIAGVPCSISMTEAPTPIVPGISGWAPAAVSVQYCDGKTEIENIVRNANDVDPQAPKSKSVCGGCSINLNSATNSAVNTVGTAVAPVKFGIYLFKTISNFFTASQDQMNIPRESEINFENLADIYNKYGQIPDRCVDQLNEGLSCHTDICAARAARAFEEVSGLKVTNAISINQNSESTNSDPQKKVWIDTPACEGEIIVPVYCPEKKSDFKVDLKYMSAFKKSCRPIVNSIKEKL